MSDLTRLEAEDVQRIENVLVDANVSSVSRRALLGRAAAGAAAVGTIGAFGPIPSALAAGSSDSAGDILNAAITAEMLAITYLSGLIANEHKTGVSKFVNVLKAANAAEYDHYKVLKSLQAKPLADRFWAPDSFFKPDNVFPTIEYAETQFVNAYLIGVTVFSKINPAYARYAAEILGVEAEHRALARFAQRKLPNNVGFESYRTHTISGIVQNLEKAGVGFGKRGKGPGAFYRFHTPSYSVLTSIEDRKPA